MAVGTFFTLFIVPSLYVLIARDHAADARARAAGNLAEGEALGPPVGAEA